MSEEPTITLRNARPDDAALAAPLLFATGRRLMTHVFGFDHDEERVLQFLRESFAQNKGSFSYRYAFVAEREGTVVGIAQGFLEGGRWRKDVALAPLLMRFYRVREYVKFLRNASHAAPFGRGIPSDAYYLACIAVDPELRGHGIGALLLEEFFKRARAQGHARTALHVSELNPRAMALYARNGFRVVAKVGDEALKQRFGLEMQLAMVRDTDVRRAE